LSILQSNLVEPVPGVGLGPGLESDSAPSQLGVAVVLVARSRADRPLNLEKIVSYYFAS